MNIIPCSSGCSRSTTFKNYSTTTVAALSICTLAGAFFIGMGIYGLHLNPDMWGSYAVMGIGGAAMSGALSYVVTRQIISSFLPRRPVNHSFPTRRYTPKPLPVLPKREVARLAYANLDDDPDKEQSAIVSSSIATIPIEMIYLIIHQIISMYSRNPQQIEASKNLCRVAATCKKFHELVNTENTVFRHLLDCVYRIGSVFFRDFNSFEEYFPKETRDKVFLTDEMLDNHSKYFGRTEYPENQDNWLNWMASKQVAIAGGIDGYHRRFFAVRLQVQKEDNSVYEHVIVFFERYSNDTFMKIIPLDNDSPFLDLSLQGLESSETFTQLFRTLVTQGEILLGEETVRLLSAPLV